MTRRVALQHKHHMNQNTAHDVHILDMTDCNLLAVHTVFISQERTPEEVRPLAERIFKADAFILATPEYNGSYSPALKNMIDHFPKQHHKPFGIVTASPGAFGGLRAAQQLLTLIPGLFGIASPYMLIIPFVDKKFSIDGQLLDESFYKNIHNFVTEFLWLAEKVVDEKIEQIADQK